MAGVEGILAASSWQGRCKVERVLRFEQVQRGSPWPQRAVGVRSANEAEARGRDLRRRGVPLASRKPAVLLRAEPAAAALLDIVRAGLRDQLGDGGEPPQREAAINLLTSPLVGLTTMDLRRLRRRLRQDHDAVSSRRAPERRRHPEERIRGPAPTLRSWPC